MINNFLFKVLIILSVIIFATALGAFAAWLLWFHLWIFWLSLIGVVIALGAIGGARGETEKQNK